MLAGKITYPNFRLHLDFVIAVLIFLKRMLFSRVNLNCQRRQQFLVKVLTFQEKQETGEINP